MKPIPLFKKILLACAFSALIFSCNKNDDDGGPTDDTPNLSTISELAGTVDILSSLVAALQTADAGLIEALSADGSITVFAPTNDAFDTLFEVLEGFDSLDDFDTEEEKALLAKILQYHVISGTAAFSDQLSNGQVLETLQTETLTINVDGSVFVQDKTDDLAEVVSADNEASNGVVHIVDKVLLPQEVLDILFPQPNIVELVMEMEDLSLLEEAMIAAGLDDDLSADGPFTVFAPTNAAIQALFDLLGDNFNGFEDFDNVVEIQILKQILLYHVVPGNLRSSNLAPGTLNTLVDGETLEVIASGDTFVIGDASDVDANLIAVDNEASNGIVHIVDKILIPQEVQDFLDVLNGGDNGDGGDLPTDGLTIKELVEADDSFSLLGDALEITGLLDTLDGGGPFTVFAPSNTDFLGLLALAGFEGLIDDSDISQLGEKEITLLREILLYHVLGMELKSGDFSNGTTVTTLSGDNPLRFETSDTGIALIDTTGLPANFVLTDIPASNGVIHVVDRILIPDSIIDTLIAEVESIDLRELLDNLRDNEMVLSAIMMVSDRFEEILDNSNEFTFFLPTNQAFLDLFNQLDGIDSLADFDTVPELELLATILSYHVVVNTAAFSTDLSNGQTISTFQGESLEIAIDGNVYILDKTDVPAKVTAADRSVVNGVIHFIDRVLLPQEALDSL